ncbi:hypothetical protein BT63DRAFT_460058 [Microthyrium microscopicum]|uniref:Uncharacterized protein n=1 Tax=Microthyrium microscopicum TaxID=703497 RepID=A0A6A6TZG5_9PEZI|nr:hypothetical protein BT63DRAFT_460058 [Microthyrium microscopicum]
MYDGPWDLAAARSCLGTGGSCQLFGPCFACLWLSALQNLGGSCSKLTLVGSWAQTLLRGWEGPGPSVWWALDLVDHTCNSQWGQWPGSQDKPRHAHQLDLAPPSTLPRLASHQPSRPELQLPAKARERARALWGAMSVVETLIPMNLFIGIHSPLKSNNVNINNWIAWEYSVIQSIEIQTGTQRTPFPHHPTHWILIPWSPCSHRHFAGKLSLDRSIEEPVRLAQLWRRRKSQAFWSCVPAPRTSHLTTVRRTSSISKSQK